MIIYNYGAKLTLKNKTHQHLLGLKSIFMI